MTNETETQVIINFLNQLQTYGNSVCTGIFLALGMGVIICGAESNKISLREYLDTFLKTIKKDFENLINNHELLTKGEK